MVNTTQGIDRDALMEALRRSVAVPANENWVWNTANAVLALVQPVEGVTLNREDASLAAHFVRDHIGTGWADPIWPTDDHLRALVDRLEASA